MKLKRFGALSVLRHPRALWQFLRNPDESLLRRVAALAAIVYVISPVDLIPDAIPVLGWLDDIGVIALVLGWTAQHVKKYTTAPARVQHTRRALPPGAAEPDWR